MTLTSRSRRRPVLLVVAFASLGAAVLAAQATPPATPPPKAAAPLPKLADPLDGGWPREIRTSAGVITAYQPQIDSWDGSRLALYAAIALKEKEDAEPIYGVVWADGNTVVDKESRLVTFTDREFKRVAFPSHPEKNGPLLEVVRKDVAPVTRSLALDRLAALLEVAEADKAVRSLQLDHTPPRIVFSATPAILAYVDGEPAWRPVKETKLERAINTRVLLLRRGDDRYYLHVFDGWMTAKALEGPWEPEKDSSKDLKKAEADAKASGQVDLLPGGNPNDAKTLPSLKQGRSPKIVVATKPTELIVTDGGPNYIPIEGTELLYVKNTTGNIFRHTRDQKIYVLVSGRWFRSATPEGPWEYVANDSLPPDFAKIPDESEKENVKAAVAGTPQAKEAIISNLIPQTAEVKVADAKMEAPRYDGEAKLVPIEGTPLHYVANTATPVIQVSPTSYYAVENGVWFTSAAPAGPWAVATSVPSVIYTIPPSSPVHYVTYVRVYQATATTVYTGYTPGYYGTVISNGTVVYGTGYAYPPYVGSTVWYGPPMTYGCGVGVTYTPWTGWTYGFGFGWSWGAVTVGWGWGAYPWWGPVGYGYYYPYPYYRPPYWGGAAWGPWGGGAVWGPGGWAATTGNVYSRWGSTSAVTRRSGGYNAWTGDAWRNSAGMSYNSRTGNLSAGQRSAVGNVYSGNYAYGGRGGTVNTKTGGSVSGGRVTAGNVYTGNQVTAGRISGTTGSGQSGSAAWARGEQGGVARVGDDIYAGKDGNVYKRNEGGGWEQQQPGSGSWQGVQDRDRTGTLDAQQRARSDGAQRAGGYDQARASGYGQGYRSAGGGGWGGGGARGGGGRRR
jgi:hypothetical protein